MASKVVVGPFSKGLRNDIIPAFIDNDAFPQIINAYQWRGRVKRKRGTSSICRLQRWFDSTKTAYGITTTFNLSGDSGNLISGFGLNNVGNIPANTGTLVPGHVTFTVGGIQYTDPTMDGFLTPKGSDPPGFNTINYATGAITITGAGGSAVTLATFSYYPALPVMDIEELVLDPTAFPQSLDFDTTYAYQIVTAAPYYAYDVSFYKNPAANGTTMPGYTPKTSWTPVRWNGQNYQQFWSYNYEGSIWATNGIPQPFVTTNLGMQFKQLTSATLVALSTTDVDFVTTNNHPLVVGDFVFINEVTGITGLNFQTGYVISGVGATTFRARFPNAVISGGPGAGGIVQALTSNCQPNVSSTIPTSTRDCLRWYDGDPTNGVQFAPSFVQGNGWVNFAPPIYTAAPTGGVIGDLPSAVYYLVGARMILPYKDRILFFGPVLQTSASSPALFYLQDTVVFSQNGSPYYTASFDESVTGAVTSARTQFFPLLTPVNQNAQANAYFVAVTGYGGFISAGFAQPIITVGYNQDVIIVGFSNRQLKLLYTGNDLLPFNFYIINSELGSTSTFSAIILDRGVMTFGDKGIVLTDQQSTSRVDLDIPDQVFQIDITNNGLQRLTAQRDFINEWLYFTYPSNTEEDATSPFPNQTLFYNYRDETWSIFNESYTTYGPFRRQTSFTWQTVGSFFADWDAWTEPWDSSSSSLLNPEVIAGNQQGFVVTREDRSISEAPSLYIQAISGFTVTSPNHGLDSGDFVFFLNAIGMTNFNSSPTATPPSYIIWQITKVDANSFTIASDPPLVPTGTYAGNGTITRLYVPFIQTKQFPVAWAFERKTRIGVQQYLFTQTSSAQITLLIYLSQNDGTPFNEPPYLPDVNSQNNSVVYSDILYTCYENVQGIGVTAPNVNLQQQVPGSARLWHRMNTSLIGDTVQVGFTLNDDQMFDSTLTNQISEIELHGIVINVYPSQFTS